MSTPRLLLSLLTTAIFLTLAILQVLDRNWWLVALWGFACFAMAMHTALAWRASARGALDGDADE